MGCAVRDDIGLKLEKLEFRLIVLMLGLELPAGSRFRVLEEQKMIYGF